MADTRRKPGGAGRPSTREFSVDEQALKRLTAEKLRDARKSVDARRLRFSDAVSVETMRRIVK